MYYIRNQSMFNDLLIDSNFKQVYIIFMKNNIYEQRRTERFNAYVKRYGFRYTVSYAMHKLFAPVLHFYFNKVHKQEFFFYNNKNLPYFYHKYRSTWANERIIEIPIFRDILKENTGGKILEIGNVISHYDKVHHEIIDKYENDPSIIREDILDFRPVEKFDLIISISTFEHVGWDEEPRAPEKIFPVMESVKNLLKPGGKLIFSVPVGYNPELDKFIFEGKITLNNAHYLKRVSSSNKWIEATEKDARTAVYGKPFFCANVLLLGEIKN